MKLRAFSPRVLLALIPIAGVVVVLLAVVVRNTPTDGGRISGESWRPRTEQEWIVADIVSTIGRIAAFGNLRVAAPAWAVETRPAASGELARFDAAAVSPSRLHTTISIRSHIWAPDAYAPIAAVVVKGLARQDARADGEDTIAKLTDLNATVLEDVNERLSAELRRRPLNADLHDQAALLAVALAIREQSGPFLDVRPALNRAVAHLALAEALRGGRQSTTLVGRIAECGVIVLAGRQADARQPLAALQGEALSPSARRWVQALRVLTAYDWRVLRGATDLSPIETRVHLRALHTRIGGAAAEEEADRLAAADLVDTGWLILSRDFNVGAGNRFAQPTLARTIAETTDMARRFGLDASTLTSVTQAVAGSAGAETRGQTRPVKQADEARILDWKLMAGFYERHLLHAIAGVAQMFDNVGLPDDRREFDGKTDWTFRALPLYPVLPLLHPSDPARIPPAIKLVTLLARWQPQRLTAEAWGWLAQDPKKGTLAEASAAWNEWFVPRNPAGTALTDVYRRLRGPCACENPPPAAVAQARVVAPLRAVVADIDVEQRYGQHPQLADLQREYGDLADFDVSAMNRLAWSAADQPAEFAKLYTRVCEFVPDNYAYLGTYFAARDLDDDAARAFRQMVTRGDPVASTAYIEWLINYEADHGRINEALRLASDAAAVYSASGLEAKADLLERLGRYGEAEALHRAVADRYKSEWGLMAFHQRRSAHDQSGRHADEAARLMTLLGKGYMQPVSLAALVRDGQPDAGVLVTDAGPRLARAGLKDGDIIVTVNGIRVADWQQFWYAVRFSDDPRVTFLAWRAGHYFDATAVFKHHYMAARVDSYRRQ